MTRQSGSGLGAAPAGLLLLLSACAAPSPSQSGQASTPPRQRCVPNTPVAPPVVRDDGRVYLRGEPDDKQSFLLRFKGDRCPGLNRFAVVTIESQGSLICEGDGITVTQPPSTIPGPRCVIDRIEPFSGAVDSPVPGE